MKHIIIITTITIIIIIITTIAHLLHAPRRQRVLQTDVGREGRLDELRAQAVRERQGREPWARQCLPTGSAAGAQIKRGALLHLEQRQEITITITVTSPYLPLPPPSPSLTPFNHPHLEEALAPRALQHQPQVHAVRPQHAQRGAQLPLPRRPLPLAVQRRRRVRVLDGAQVERGAAHARRDLQCAGACVYAFARVRVYACE